MTAQTSVPEWAQDLVVAPEPKQSPDAKSSPAAKVSPVVRGSSMESEYAATAAMFVATLPVGIFYEGRLLVKGGHFPTPAERDSGCSRSFLYCGTFS